jgi:hypothetical protein
LRTSIIFLLFIIIFCGCHRQRFSSEEELWDYLRDEKNGYIQSKKINGVDFTLLYKPTDVLVKQEIADKASKEEIEKLREKYSNYLYFNLSMSVNQKELLSAVPANRNEFGAMVNQLAFGMNEKVHLYTQSKDTIELTDYIYPRMYGMSRATTIMFVYPREEALQEKTLNFTIEDLGMYTGEVKFKLDTEKLQQEPKLKF